jgi:hypothetical protein
VISGVSSPARAGAPVLLQRRGSRGWVTVMSSTFTTESTSTTTGAAYSFTIRHTSSKVNRYRVVVPADSGRLQRISGELRVTVYRARITGVHATGDEYVTIKNTGTMTVNLAGWKLRNAAGVTRTLGTRLVAAGASLRIHSGSGRNNTSNLYLGRSAMWGNSHDTATLFDARAFKLSELTY